MDVRRDFKKRPPKWKGEPTLADLVDDFAWRFPRSERDPVADYTAEAPNISVAVQRACDSRGADGKMSNHQSKVPHESRMTLARKLKLHGVKLVTMESFDELFDFVDEKGSGIVGIGPVTTYDVAYRIGHYLGIAPTSLYLHAGVKAGATALGLNVRGKRRLTEEELPLELMAMEANDIEDFMCTYREVMHPGMLEG